MINAVAAEQFAGERDKIIRAAAFAPSVRGNSEIGDNERLAEQMIQERLHGVFGFDDAQARSDARGAEN